MLEEFVDFPLDNRVISKIEKLLECLGGSVS